MAPRHPRQRPSRSSTQALTAYTGKIVARIAETMRAEALDVEVAELRRELTA